MHSVSPAFGGIIIVTAAIFAIAYAFGVSPQLLALIGVLAAHGRDLLATAWSALQQAVQAPG